MANRVAVVTIFPELISHYFTKGVVRRSQDAGLDLRLYDLRAYGEGIHQSVDDRPYGGGPGMVLRADILLKALEDIRKWLPHAMTVAFSPLGQQIHQKKIEALTSSERDLILFCGRYEGFDQRFLDRYIDEQWSLGDFVLSGGELPAMAVLDMMSRLLPGVLSSMESVRQESFTSDLLDYPHYTRPAIFEGIAVPDVLLSGHHEHIAQWRQQKSLELTAELRPDLLDRQEK